MEKVLFFDGYCNLCNNTVDSLVRWDKNAILKFASLQGETAAKLLPQSARQGAEPETVIYLRDGKIYDRSTAILLVLKDIGGIYALSGLFFVVPKFLRDLVYRFIARIRYKVFGKRESCRIPTPEERSRFLP